MLSTNLKQAFRNFRRNKLFIFLSLSGLTVGLTCSLAIMLYIQNELSYDRHYENADRIYRIGAEYTIAGKVSQYANIPRPVGPTLKQDYPEVLEMTRLVKYNRITENPVFISLENNKDRTIEEDLVFFADSTLFEVFSYKLLQGEKRTALNRKNTAVLTEETAFKLFGTDNPIGKVIVLDEKERCEITGVIADPPATSHLNFEILISWSTLHTEADLSRWIGGHAYTYLLFPEHHDIEGFKQKWPEFYEQYMAETFNQFGGKCDILIQPLSDIHLTSNLIWEVSENGDLAMVYVFAAVGIFILIIACINYINLATARATKRAMEVGIRKVVGAERSALIKQFLSETTILVFLATVAAVIFTILLLPKLNEFAGLYLELSSLLQPAILGGILLTAVLVVILSGSYPAFYLSALVPTKVLMSKLSDGVRNFSLSHLLVTVQFVISIAIIISTFVVRDQLAYIAEKDLGFEKDGVLAVAARGPQIAGKLPLIKNELMQHPNILKAAVSQNIPGNDINMTALSVETEDGAMLEQELQFLEFDEDFLDLMSIEILAGRTFDRTITTDKEEAVIVNESLANKFNWEEPIGKRVEAGPFKAKIVGVVQDFHMESLHNPIAPMISVPVFDSGSWIYLRVNTANLSETLAFIEKKWREFDPIFPFSYVFVDDYLQSVYSNDEKLAQLFGLFSFIAIFISCLGLLGLSAMTAQQRLKEIGIRKTLGASIANLVFVLSKKYMVLVLLANVIAWPLAYFAMDRWLQSFAYQTELSLSIFVFGGVMALLIALATISVQTIKAAMVNPAEILRYE